MPAISGKILEKQVFVDNLVTTTFYKVRESLIDQVFQIIPFFDKMVENGRIRERAPDGTHWEIPVRYAKQDQNVKYLTRGGTMGTQEKESLTRLYYTTSVIANSMVRVWDDERRNRGKAKLLDWVDELVENSTESLRDAIAEDLLVQNADPQAINAIGTLFPNDPTTGIIAKFDRSINPWLRNKTKDFTGLTTAASLVLEMETMYNQCSLLRGKGQKKNPDIILTTRQIYQDYKNLARAMGVFEMNTSNRRVDMGMGELSFNGAEIFWDPNCPSGCMYFLNTSTLEVPYDPENWFEMTPWKPVHNSMDRYAQIVAICNMTCNNFQKNGVIYNITATSN